METVSDLRLVSLILSLTMAFGEVKKHLLLHEFCLCSLKVSTGVKDSFVSFY
jgi:hypothetical protein